MVNFASYVSRVLVKVRFPLGGPIRANRQKVGSVPTCSRISKIAKKC